MPYYTEIKKWSTKYAATIGMCGSHSHDYETAPAEEFVVWDKIVTKSSCRGRIHRYNYQKWDCNNDMYDSAIAETIHHSRWFQLKRAIKL
mmetsp:Transcript_30480/g.35148  ORF Transcript_30480/g.35148 Transcript_30480/m.35148 type:complete len:90 (+) Transcript_30480:877-1146(+)